MDMEKLENDLARENLSLAPLSKRIQATVIDDLLISALLIFAFWNEVTNAQSYEEIANVFNSFLSGIIFLKILYQGFFTYFYGGTLGKIWMKIIIVKEEDFYKPDLISSFTRSSFRIISEMIFYLGFLLGFIDPAKQTLHDKIGKTIVLNA